LIKQLQVVSTDEVLPLLEFSTEGELYPARFAMATGVKTYPVEGFRAFTRRRELAKQVTQGEGDIGYWILKEAEERLARGDRAAQDYVQAMDCLSQTPWKNAREVFRWCNEMEQIENN